MSDFEFSEEEIQQRFEDFFDIARDFCDSFNRGQSARVAVDPFLLFQCVVATYDDIARYKSYHLKNPATQKANAIKRAAYAVKWIIHFSPLIFPQLAHDNEDEAVEVDDDAVLANVMFAMHFALINLREYAQRSFNLNRELNFEIMYDLLYRNLSPEALMLFFHNVAELARTGQIEAILE
jgi:hypothetical protein